MKITADAVNFNARFRPHYLLIRLQLFFIMYVCNLESFHYWVQSFWFIILILIIITSTLPSGRSTAPVLSPKLLCSLPLFLFAYLSFLVMSSINFIFLPPLLTSPSTVPSSIVDNDSFLLNICPSQFSLLQRIVASNVILSLNIFNASFVLISVRFKFSFLF